MTSIQEWLETNYPDKTVTGRLGLSLSTTTREEAEKLTGELLIKDYVNIEEIVFDCWNKEGQKIGKITKVTIGNCPKVKKIKLNAQEITEIILEDDLLNLEWLDAYDNKLTEIDISHAPNLKRLHIARNPQVNKVKGIENLTRFDTLNLLGTLGFNGQELKKWKETVKEALGITPNDSLPDTWKVDLKTKLDELEKRPTQAQLTQAVQEEKAKYLNHTSPEKLAADYFAKDKLEAEAKNKGMFSKEEYNKVVEEKESRPNITKEKWDSDYSKRPEQTELDKVQAELNKIKTLLGLNSGDALPTGWENRLVAKNDLDQANQKVQDYEKDLKIKLGLTDDDLPKWKDEIDKLKNRPTSDNSDQIKGILGLNPTDSLPTDWPTKLAKKDDLKATQDSLKKWTDKFPDKDPEKLEKELNDLKSKPTGSAPLTPEQQQKLNDYDKVVRQRDNRPNINLDQYNTIGIYIKKKLGKINWQEVILGADWETKAKIEQINK